MNIYIKYLKSITLIRTLSVLSIIALLIFIVSVYTNMQNSLWGDETFSGMAVKENIQGIIYVALNDNNPPLFHLLTHFVISLIGQNEFTMRLISLLSIILTAGIVRKIPKEKEIKELATIFFLTNVNAYSQATEARYYALFMFLSALTFYLLTKFTEKFTIKIAIFYIIATIALLYTQSLGIIMVVTNGVIHLFALLRKGEINKKIIVNYILIYSIIAIFFLPWIFTIINQFDNLHNNNFWLKFVPFTSTFSTFINFISLLPVNTPHNLNNTKLLLTFMGICLYILILSIGIINSHKEKKFSYLIAFILPFSLFFIISFKQPIMYIRYLVFILPFVSILFAEGIYNFYKICIVFTSKAKKYKFPIIIALSVILVTFNTLQYLIFYSHDTKQPLKQLAQELNTKGYKDYTAIANSEGIFYQCKYYLNNCKLVKSRNKINKNVGVSLIKDTDLITPNNLPSYNNIVWVFGRESKVDKKNRENLFKDYKLIDRVSAKTPVSAVYSIVLSKEH